MNVLVKKSVQEKREKPDPQVSHQEMLYNISHLGYVFSLMLPLTEEGDQ
jgi:hypothetical protein